MMAGTFTQQGSVLPVTRTAAADGVAMEDVLLEAFRWMVLARTFDQKCVNKQRLGEMGTYPPTTGQEATIVGVALATDPARDWIVPQYREAIALVHHGLPLEQILLYFRGDPRGGAIPEDVRALPFQIALAAQLPHATGIAWAQRLHGSDGVVVAFVGDGASSEGDFHEALNLAGVLPAPVVFVLQNNGWAISTPRERQTAASSFAARATGYGFDGAVVDGTDVAEVYSATATAVALARETHRPTLIEAVTTRIGPHNTADDPRRYRTGESDDLDPIERLRTELVLRGALDAQMEEKLVADARATVAAAFEKADALSPVEPGDLMISPPERRRTGATGLGISRTTPALNVVGAVREALETALVTDPRVMLLGQDIGANGGVFRATDGLHARFAQRVADMPICEAGMVGAAIGLASEGIVPVVELQFLPFSHQAFHQIAGQLTRLRARSRGRFVLQVTIRTPYGGGAHTPELHADSLESQLTSIAGLKVVAPATARDAKGLLLAAIRDPEPVVVLEPLAGYRGTSDIVPVEDYTTPYAARLAREGADVTLVAWSSTVHQCIRVADDLDAEDISCSVVDLRSLVPLDVGLLAEQAEKTRRVVVVHEAPVASGFGAEVAASVSEAAFGSLVTPVRRVGALNLPHPFYGAEEHYLPSDAQVAAAVRLSMMTG